MKPDKITIKRYLKILFKDFVSKQKEIAKKRRFKRLTKKRGYWYCAHCDAMHDPRTIEYVVFGGNVNSVCSVGKKEYLAWVPEEKGDQPYTEEDFRPFIRGIEIAKGGRKL